MNRAVDTANAPTKRRFDRLLGAGLAAAVSLPPRRAPPGSWPGLMAEAPRARPALWEGATETTSTIRHFHTIDARHLWFDARSRPSTARARLCSKRSPRHPAQVRAIGRSVAARSRVKASSPPPAARSSAAAPTACRSDARTACCAAPHPPGALPSRGSSSRRQLRTFGASAAAPPPVAPVRPAPIRAGKPRDLLAHEGGATRALRVDAAGFEANVAYRLPSRPQCALRRMDRAAPRPAGNGLRGRRLGTSRWQGQRPEVAVGEGDRSAPHRLGGNSCVPRPDSV